MTLNEADQVRRYIQKARLSSITTRLYRAGDGFGLEVKADGRRTRTQNSGAAVSFLRDVARVRRDLWSGSRYRPQGGGSR